MYIFADQGVAGLPVPPRLLTLCPAAYCPCAPGYIYIYIYLHICIYIYLQTKVWQDSPFPGGANKIYFHLQPSVRIDAGHVILIS